jgi:hypothetical protein
MTERKKPSSREEFFDSFWPTLQSKDWTAIILHSWQNLPKVIESDVDYAVSGCQPSDLLGFLAEFCRNHGWRLVQVIEHEPRAYFCVCVQNGGDFESLALDVTWDYRRLGHLLIPSAKLHKGSKAAVGKSFQIPSPGTEASYILAKAAAKSKDFSEIASPLKELIDQDPVDCQRALHENLDCSLQRGTSSDILHQLRNWYPEAENFRAVRTGKRYGTEEIQLYLRRCLNPTGLWLSFQKHLDSDTLDEILKPIMPLFRRVHFCNRTSFPRSYKQIIQAIRTSLVVENNSGRTVSSGNWRFTIDPTTSRDPQQHSIRILEQMAARVEHRIPIS